MKYCLIASHLDSEERLILLKRAINSVRKYVDKIILSVSLEISARKLQIENIDTIFQHEKSKTQFEHLRYITLNINIPDETQIIFLDDDDQVVAEPPFHLKRVIGTLIEISSELGTLIENGVSSKLGTSENETRKNDFCGTICLYSDLLSFFREYKYDERVIQKRYILYDVFFTNYLKEDLKAKTDHEPYILITPWNNPKTWQKNLRQRNECYKKVILALLT